MPPSQKFCEDSLVKVYDLADQIDRWVLRKYNVWHSRSANMVQPDRTMYPIAKREKIHIFLTTARCPFLIYAQGIGRSDRCGVAVNRDKAGSAYPGRSNRAGGSFLGRGLPLQLVENEVVARVMLVGRCRLATHISRLKSAARCTNFWRWRQSDLRSAGSELTRLRIRPLDVTLETLKFRVRLRLYSSSGAVIGVSRR